jgi:hypothetical protein
MSFDIRLSEQVAARLPDRHMRDRFCATIYKVISPALETRHQWGDDEGLFVLPAIRSGDPEFYVVCLRKEMVIHISFAGEIYERDEISGLKAFGSVPHGATACNRWVH